MGGAKSRKAGNSEEAQRAGGIGLRRQKRASAIQERGARSEGAKSADCWNGGGRSDKVGVGGHGRGQQTGQDRG